MLVRSILSNSIDWRDILYVLTLVWWWFWNLAVLEMDHAFLILLVHRKWAILQWYCAHRWQFWLGSRLKGSWLRGHIELWWYNHWRVNFENGFIGSNSRQWIGACIVHVMDHYCVVIGALAWWHVQLWLDLWCCAVLVWFEYLLLWFCCILLFWDDP